MTRRPDLHAPDPTPPLARAVRLARAVHRLTMRLHPAGFRDEYGEDLDRAFEEGASEAHAEGGATHVLVFLFRAMFDAVRTTVTERSILRMRDGDLAREDARTERAGDFLRHAVRDARIGLRMLIRRPGFAAIAIGTLALGLGATVTVFSVVNGVVLRALPFPDSHELYRVYHVNARSGSDRGSFSFVDREDWVAAGSAFEHLAVYSTLPSGPLLTGGEVAVELRTAYVSAGFFDVLGRDALHGRVLLDPEERGDNRVVVLSHAFWESALGADESLVGTTIQIDDSPFLLAGVMPPDFGFPSPDVEAWVFISTIPQSSTPWQIRGVRFLEAVGRIPEGISAERAEESLSATASSLARAYPDDNENLDRVALVPLRESIIANVGATLFLILGAVALVLVIACANIANLLLARGVDRARELSLRHALGAGRRRILQQLLTESALISLAGGLAGVALAYWGTGALLAPSGSLLPRAAEIQVDAPVLWFALGVVVLTTIAFGLLPALAVTRSSQGAGLPSTARQGRASSASSKGWGALVATQVGLAMVLVLASGLLLRSVGALQRVDPGIESDRMVVASLTINDARYPTSSDYLAAYDQIMERIEAIPAVESVASIRFLPLERDGESSEFTVPARAGRPAVENASASLLQVSPGFFATAGVPLLSGREFTGADLADAPPVVIINQTLKALHWPDVDPVGSFVEGLGGAPVQIVAVVGDVRQRGLAEPARPTVYAPQAQNPRRGMTFVVRTASDPEPLLGEVRSAILAVDPDQPITGLRVMDDVRAASVAQSRFFSLLLTGFGGLGLLLASIGIYGVVSNSVSRRTAEIGVRMALGASRAEVARMVVGRGMLPVVVGAAVGLVVAAVGVGFLEAILYGVAPRDPVTFAVVPVLLLGVGFVACWVPAMGALRVDPIQALRAE